MGSNFMLEVEDLEKSYKNVKAVDGVNLNVFRGDVFGFLGPNGAGKTTTIRMILGLINSDAGQVKIDGLNIRDDFMRAVEKVGAVVETPKFYNYLSGYQNLQQIARLHKGINEKQVESVLELVGMKYRAHDRVSTYSLGMKQRLGIARALLNNPELIILDEPTNGLDPEGIKEVRELIKSLAVEKEITFFISTHLLNEVEQICNRVAVLNKGKVISSGLVSNLLDKNVEVLKIVTEEISKASSILSDITGVEIIDNMENNQEDKNYNYISVKVNKSLTTEINSILLENGVCVEYIIPERNSLEDYYLEITRGGKTNE